VPAAEGEKNKRVTKNEIDHQTFTSTPRFSKGTPTVAELKLFLLEKYVRNIRAGESS
jgi:hypothetical protein